MTTFLFFKKIFNMPFKTARKRGRYAPSSRGRPLKISSSFKAKLERLQHHKRDRQQEMARSAALKASQLTTPFKPLNILGKNPMQRVCWSKDAPFAPFMHTTLHTRQMRYLVNKQLYSTAYAGVTPGRDCGVTAATVAANGDMTLYNASTTAPTADGHVRGFFIPAVPGPSGQLVSTSGAQDKLGTGQLPFFERFAGLGYAYYTVTAARIKVRLVNDLIGSDGAEARATRQAGTDAAADHGTTNVDDDEFATFNQYQPKRRLYMMLDLCERAVNPANEEPAETGPTTMETGPCSKFNDVDGTTTIPTSDWRYRGKGPLFQRRFLEENLRHQAIDDQKFKDTVLYGNWSLEGHYGLSFPDIFKNSFEQLLENNGTSFGKDFETYRDKTFTGVIANNLYNELSTQGPGITWNWTSSPLKINKSAAAGWHVWIDTDHHSDYTRLNGHDQFVVDVEYDICFWGMPPKNAMRKPATDPAA